MEAIAALTASERARAEQHHVPDHGDPVPVRRHDSAGGLPGGGSERAGQEAQAALGGHADPDRAGDAERGAGAHGDGVLRESADQRVLVWCLHEDEVGLRGDDRVADVLEWPGEFGAGPQGAGVDLGGVAGVAQCGERPGLGERADRERGADLAQGGDDARIGDEVATRSPARPWILEKVRSTATRPEATSGRQVVASGSSVNST